MAGNLQTVGDYFELDKYQKEVLPIFEKNQLIISQKIKMAESQCMNKFVDNESKYLECMQKLNKIIQKQQRRFDYSISYWRQKTYQCYHEQAYGEKEFDRCKPESNQLLSEIFDSFKL